jgi:hypothetical protein
VNGVHKATTDEYGVYHVDIEGAATIEAIIDINNFDKLSVKANHVGDTLPDLISRSITLCGSLKMYNSKL